MLTDHDTGEAALLLVSLAIDGDGCVNTEAILARPAESLSRRAFAAAKFCGWFTPEGVVTDRGREAVERWEEGE